MGNGMTGEDRKAAIAAYKERKVIGGVYAVRCAATGEVWVGRGGPTLPTSRTASGSRCAMAAIRTRTRCALADPAWPGIRLLPVRKLDHRGW